MNLRDQYQQARARRHSAEVRIAETDDADVRAEAVRDLAQARQALEVVERLIGARDGDLTVRPRSVVAGAGIRKIG